MNGINIKEKNNTIIGFAKVNMNKTPFNSPDHIQIFEFDCELNRTLSLDAMDFILNNTNYWKNRIIAKSKPTKIKVGNPDNNCGQMLESIISGMNKCRVSELSNYFMIHLVINNVRFSNIMIELSDEIHKVLVKLVNETFSLDDIYKLNNM